MKIDYNTIGDDKVNRQIEFLTKMFSSPEDLEKAKALIAGIDIQAHINIISPDSLDGLEKIKELFGKISLPNDEDLEIKKQFFIFDKISRPQQGINTAF